VIVEASGVVLLNGVPLPKAQVRFTPLKEVKPEYIARAVTDDQGRFTLSCHAGPGAAAGENKVTVLEAEIPNHLLPETKQLELAAYLRALKNRPIPPVYATVATTPLEVTVTEEQQEYKIELRR
jgi:hypothetical protein